MPLELNLTKPICFFDLETTGTNVVKDRIVEIGIFKVFPNGNKEQYRWLVNPGIPIPLEVAEVHGITDEKVKDEPSFKVLSRKVYDILRDSDLGGYNSDRFDIPLLVEELLRAGVDIDLKKMVSVDVQTIFHKKEKRTLSAANKIYCDKELVEAHSALADTMATYEVLLSQIERYEDLENDIKSLSSFTKRRETLDFAGFLALNKEEEPIFNFGKFKGKRIKDVLEQEPGYFGWMLNADFPKYTQKVLTQIKLGTWKL